MSKLMGMIILLVGSVVLGVVCGNLFFRLFTTTVPPAVLTSFNKGTAHAAFITYGVAMGVGAFLWSLLAIFGSRFFRGGKPTSSAAH
jgi:hypothetical protein